MRKSGRVNPYLAMIAALLFVFSVLCCGNARAGGTDEGRAILVDAHGNVYVCGKSWRSSDQKFGIVTMKYSSSGKRLWARRFTDITNNGHWGQWSVALDGSGNFYITGQSLDRKLLVLKYSPAGLPVVSKYNFSGTPVGSGSSGKAIHVTPDGKSIYVTGEYWNSNNSTWDIVTAKLGKDPDMNWTSRRIASKHQFARAIVVGSNGNVTVTGQDFDSEANTYDYLTIKYNALGKIEWARTYNKGTWDEPFSVAVDPGGNAIVTGSAGSAEGTRDFVTVKYSPAGAQSPAWIYDGAAHALDYAKTVKTDASGNVYVAGTSSGAYNWDIVLLKYDASGHKVWTRSYSNLCNDFFDEMALDKNGNIYVAGHSGSGGSGTWDYLTMKYNPNGKRAWTKFFNSKYESADMALSLTVDGNANVYVTGKSYNGTDYDTLTVKYDTNGNMVWSRRYDSP